MKKYILFFILAFQINCFSQNDSTNNASLSSIEKIIMFDNHDSIQLFPDDIIIDSVYIEQNLLYLYVGYGGCSKEEIALHCSKYFLKTYPPQVEMYISKVKHISPDCEKLIIEKLPFDLTPLKETYFRNSTDTSGTIMLRIHEPNNNEPILPLVKFRF
ncbi:MAG: hypothetical protein KGZ58_02335 [Ignavibacteriales bacterium]|nr:hypothetical protein [Ignavibacteriales bacterium]